MINLKPCPFCGSKRLTVIDKNRLSAETGAPLSEHERFMPHSVMCFNCGGQTQNYRFKSSAVRSWNRRATEKTQAVKAKVKK